MAARESDAAALSDIWGTCGTSGGPALDDRSRSPSSYFVLRLFDRVVGGAVLAIGFPGLPTVTLASHIAVHPDFRDAEGLFAGALFVSQILYDIHQRVLLPSPHPTLLLSIPKSQVPAALPALRRHGYAAYPGAFVFVHTTDAANPSLDRLLSALPVCCCASTSPIKPSVPRVPRVSFAGFTEEYDVPEAWEADDDSNDVSCDP